MDKLRAFELFCRAVEAKSFSSAARALNITPSVLSRTIAALEEELACTLLHRSTRRLSLTETGAAFYDRCRELLLDIEEAEIVAREGRVRPGGRLRAGAHPAFRNPLMQSLSAFASANPNIKLELTTTNSPSSLLDEGLDVVLRIGALADSSFMARRLGSTKVVICASPAYLDAKGRPRHPRDLRDHRAVVPGRSDEPSFARWSFSHAGEQEEVAVPVGLVLREGVGLVEAALGGIGVVRIYELAARQHFAARSLEPILTKWSSAVEPVSAVLPTRRHVPEKVRAFVDYARALVGRSANAANVPMHSPRSDD